MKDLGDGNYAGIQVGKIALVSLVFFIPVEDSSDERRDQRGLCIRGSDRLCKAEKKGHVAVDFFLLKLFSGRHPFPGGGKFDENPFSIDALLTSVFFDL